MSDVFERMKNVIFGSQKVQLKISGCKHLPLKILGNHEKCYFWFSESPAENLGM